MYRSTKGSKSVILLCFEFVDGGKKKKWTRRVGTDLFKAVNTRL